MPYKDYKSPILTDWGWNSVLQWVLRYNADAWVLGMMIKSSSSPGESYMDESKLWPDEILIYNWPGLMFVRIHLNLPL